MIDIVITSDYELFGNGTGDVRRCLFQPTRDLLALCNRYGARLTLFFEIVEYWAFKLAEKKGQLDHLDYSPSRLMEEQAIDAVRTGHDVQLHPHPQWLGSRYTERGWRLNLEYVQLPKLPHGLGSREDIMSIRGLLFKGKEDLEILLTPHADDYECTVLRGGGWSLQPFHPVWQAMRDVGFLADSTVFKGGYFIEWPLYADFRQANNECIPWRAHPEDINRPADSSEKDGVWEIPIFARRLRPLHLVRPARIFRRLAGPAYRNPYGCRGSPIVPKRRNTSPRSLQEMVRYLIKPIPIQWDYCDLSAAEMWHFLTYALKKYDHDDRYIPLVMIGHSKGFPRGGGLESFLKRLTVSRPFRSGRIRFATMRRVARKLT